MLEREDRDARTCPGDQPRGAVTLLRHEHGGRVKVVDQSLDAGELVHLGVDEPFQRRSQFDGEGRSDVQTVELERHGRHGGQGLEDGAGRRGRAIAVLGAAPAGWQDVARQQPIVVLDRGPVLFAFPAHADPDDDRFEPRLA